MWIVDILTYARACLDDYEKMSGVRLRLEVATEDIYTDVIKGEKIWSLHLSHDKVTPDMDSEEFLDFLKFLAPNKSSYFKEKLRLKHTIDSKGNLIVPYKTMDMNFLSNFRVPCTVAEGCIFISGITHKESIPRILDDLRIYGKVKQ